MKIKRREVKIKRKKKEEAPIIRRKKQKTDSVVRKRKKKEAKVVIRKKQHSICKKHSGGAKVIYFFDKCPFCEENKLNITLCRTIDTLRAEITKSQTDLESCLSKIIKKGKKHET